MACRRHLVRVGELCQPVSVDVWARSSRGEAVEFFPLDDTAGNAANHFVRLFAALDVGWFVNRCKAFADPASFLEPLKCHLVKSQEVDSKKARSHPCLSFSRRMRQAYELPPFHCVSARYKRNRFNGSLPKGRSPMRSFGWLMGATTLMLLADSLRS